MQTHRSPLEVVPGAFEPFRNLLGLLERLSLSLSQQRWVCTRNLLAKAYRCQLGKPAYEPKDTGCAYSSYRIPKEDVCQRFEFQHVVFVRLEQWRYHVAKRVKLFATVVMSLWLHSVRGRY